MSTARTDEADSGAQETRPRRHRRGRRDGRQRFTTLLPHLFTTLNLAAGFYAIVVAAEGQFERAALALIIAGAADFFDGWVARLANVTSRFGVEYDSIADTVSFAVAPAIRVQNPTMKASEDPSKSPYNITSTTWRGSDPMPASSEVNQSAGDAR